MVPGTDSTQETCVTVVDRADLYTALARPRELDHDINHMQVTGLHLQIDH